MEDYIHIGSKIAEVLKKRHTTRHALAGRIGVTAGAASYLCRRETVDVRMLHKIGTALKYDFFKHFTVQEEVAAPQEAVPDERDEAITALQGQLAANRQEMTLLHQENAYLKEINALLKGKGESPGI